VAAKLASSQEGLSSVKLVHFQYFIIIKVFAEPCTFRKVNYITVSTMHNQKLFLLVSYTRYEIRIKLWVVYCVTR
jgi:hypothetical protein